MIGRCVVGGLLVCLLSASVLARPGTVRTKDGRSIEGDITDRGDNGAMITTKAGQITIKADEIAGIEYGGTIKEAYERRVAALPKDAGARSHFEIARWLYDNKEYELARKELDTAISLDPNYADAVMLRQTVDRTMLFEKRNNPGRPAGVAPAGTRPAAGGAIKERRLLNADQINTIKQFELRETEQRVRVRLDNGVAKRFIEYANRDVRDFAAMPDGLKALDILRNGTKEMRTDVRILTDPQAILEFKSKVQPTLLQGCASVACHGGSNAGRFLLYNPADNDGVTYTNFYTLSQFTAPVEKVERRAVDRLYSNNSLIIQFGLPRERAEFDHPEAQGWAFIYRNAQDTRYAQILDWIQNGLVAVQPNYGIDFPLPSTKAPATQPAAPAPAVPAPEQPKPQAPPAK
ncbi:MAG TPA: tetratricopeptide repeat protein [Tepidisphaeraceae bacterium]|jgi:hypothetical protein|nr:tetratricopeptide repeat protein [Tepidisphaeraceae bacterium]